MLQYNKQIINNIYLHFNMSNITSCTYRYIPNYKKRCGNHGNS